MYAKRSVFSSVNRIITKKNIAIGKPTLVNITADKARVNKTLLNLLILK
jgi:hypothetical protein